LSVDLNYKSNETNTAASNPKPEVHEPALSFKLARLAAAERRKQTEIGIQNEK
jgi:hypothetical protein